LALGADPAFGLAGAKGVSNLHVRVVPVGPDEANNYPPGQQVTRRYCQVEFTYNSGKSGPKDGYAKGQDQAIGIRVGLPLREDDGGTANSWNGKIHNLGSGGCMGYMPSVTSATNDGYASAVSDGGHGLPYVGFNCGFGVVQDEHRLNAGMIRDFSKDHIIAQTMWSKVIAATYYGQNARRTYWSGCSQGGREAFIILENIPEQYDGVLGGGAALYWQPFQMEQAWPGLVIKDMLKTKGKTLTGEQIKATVDAEIAACDSLDGVRDGVLGDPRACHWSAKAAICGAKNAPQSGCLDADQALAFDTIRNGPHNSKGELIYFTVDTGAYFSNDMNYLNAESVMQWATKDNNWNMSHLYMDKAHLAAAYDPLGITYEDMATLASQSASDLADTDAMPAKTLDTSKLKFISWTGTADRNIQSRNSIRYLRELAAHEHVNMTDPKIQSWYHLIIYPGVDHCGGGDGPQPGNPFSGPLFSALVSWVEEGKAPDRLIATRYAGQQRPPVPLAPAAPRMADTSTIVGTRPVCAYPKMAVYSGKGSTDDANNFACAGNAETPAIVAQDKLARHKAENGTGIVPKPYGG
jgi:feruloyl esterase